MLEIFTDADPMRADDFALPTDGWRDVKNNIAHRAQEGKMNSYYGVIKIGSNEDTVFVDACTIGDAREHLYYIGATQIIRIEKI